MSVFCAPYGSTTGTTYPDRHGQSHTPPLMRQDTPTGRVGFLRAFGLIAPTARGHCWQQKRHQTARRSGTGSEVAQ